jgi:hypothetical protein
MLAAVGVTISSSLTLVIFFPRSVEGEIAVKEASRSVRDNHTQRGSISMIETQQSHFSPTLPRGKGPRSDDGHDMFAMSVSPRSASSQNRSMLQEGGQSMSAIPFRPNRKYGGEVLDEESAEGKLELEPEMAASISPHYQKRSNVNPMVHNFTSPIGELFSPFVLSAN